MNIIEVTPTVSASAIYAANDAVGGLLAFGGVKRNGILHHVMIIDADNQKVNTDLILFSSRPGTVTADNVAFAIADAADRAKVIGIVQLTTHLSTGTTGISYGANLSFPFKTDGTENSYIFGQLITRGTPTYATTTALRVVASFLKAADSE
jgi:hypothetical protein